jgi:uncharacterized protein (TIGR00255 family)
MSLASMTGFARCEGALGDWSWAVEARSVNGRNLEVRFRGPPGLDGLERMTREAAQARFQRGQISLTVQGRQVSDARRARVNIKALEHFLALGESLVAAGRALPPSLDGLLALPGVLETGDQEETVADRAALEAAMMTTIHGGLDALKQSRGREGAAMAALLGGFLGRIEDLTRAAEIEAARQPGLIKARFEQRLSELLADGVGSDRIAQEAAVMAVKADVREEIDRLASHIVAARGLLGDANASGRRLDFLVQEFMREANTLCSKSATTALTAIGLDLKAVIDQFREQVQNVE